MRQRITLPIEQNGMNIQTNINCYKCGLCCKEMKPDCKEYELNGCKNKPKECEEFYCELYPIKALKYLVKEEK